LKSGKKQYSDKSGYCFYLPHMVLPQQITEESDYQARRQSTAATEEAVKSVLTINSMLSDESGKMRFHSGF